MLNFEEDKKYANIVRSLSLDMVEECGSGHPGAPLGMADFATVLWRHFLKYNPKLPSHPDRDRFVLSNGHASALLYALLHLSGFPISIEDMKQFRQIGSHLAGHPEKNAALGIETTTGPLGQGLANAVGMAMSRDYLRSEKLASHQYTVWAFVGDGCLMEGISHESASLAGTLGLDNLIVFYDANQITIDGHIDGWFQEDVKKRFEAYGWSVIDNVDGHDFKEIHESIHHALSLKGPVLIKCHTSIGKGIPDWEGKHQCHGQALGEDRYQKTKKAIGVIKPFMVPEDIYDHWQTSQPTYLMEEPVTPITLKDHTNFEQIFIEAKKMTQAIATRKSSQWVLERINRKGLVGGSADLTASNLTKVSTSIPRVPEKIDGNYINYGVREFAMSAIANGMALEGNIIPYVATFLVFSDYAKNAIRMSALMKLQVIYIFTHDSIGLGEDGPTHQPVEQLTMLRATPNLNVWRPANTLETICAWESALKEADTPSCLVLSRQSVPAFTNITRENVLRGGYCLLQPNAPVMVIVATGSEVSLALSVAESLNSKGVLIQVVSMPCMEVFREQSSEYKANVIPQDVPVVAIEAGAKATWYEWAGRDGLVIGLDDFGMSGPGKEVMEIMNFSKEKVLEQVLSFMQSKKMRMEYQ
ncbi:MAG: transketolase [Legionellales bacterium]|nr:transketolase [Legionellales bacterium]OUX64865.1 MAG: hypothetical protein CBE41_02520 [Gammaproteobacteria bacterium TMED281]